MKSNPGRMSRVGYAREELRQAAKEVLDGCDKSPQQSVKLVTMATDTGRVLDEVDISGAPDVIFFNAALRHFTWQWATPVRLT